jgi:putative ubiquitin-RnfH superfamily antitoxin RatB of RatAB toxin-antitoxin module
MRIHVAYVAPDTELLVALDLADGATVDDAIRESGVPERAGIIPDAGSLAVFGRRVTGATILRDGDRVEITRPLLCDPKAVRRDRAGRKAAHAAVDRTQGASRRRSRI